MARDRGLEELIANDLNSERGIKEKAMFGGWAWLLDRKLFCGARDDGMLIRLGKGNDAWALQISGIVPMVSRNRVIQGWVRADPRVYGDDNLRAKLVSSALAFVRSLPTR